MARVWWIVIAVPVLGLGGCWVMRALRSDEARIKYVLEGLAGSFNDQNARTFVRGLSEDFTDRHHSLDRSSVRAVLVRIFTDPGQRENGKFKFRVELRNVESGIQVGVPGEGQATAKFQALLLRDAPDSTDPLWSGDFEVLLEEDNGNWLVSKSDYQKTLGNLPF